MPAIEGGGCDKIVFIIQTTKQRQWWRKSRREKDVVGQRRLASLRLAKRQPWKAVCYGSQWRSERDSGGGYCRWWLGCVEREREKTWVWVLKNSVSILKKKKKSNPANVFDLISIHMIIFFIQLKLIIFFLFRADVAFFNAKKHFLLLIQATWTLIYFF